MWHTLHVDEVARNVKTNINKGLTEEEVIRRRQKEGRNQLQEKKKENIIIKFLKQFNDFMIIILIVASIISAVMAYIEGTNDYMDSIIIIAIVIFNAIMGLVQEAKAEKSLEALKKMAAPLAKVRRNGKVVTIASEELVRGDIVILEAGNFVPADCRLINSFNLKVEESTLTGETLPVTKDASIILSKDVSLADTINMVFSTTIVVNGHAEGIVVETGMNTNVGKTLGIACLIICFVIFIIGIMKKIPIGEMFMTSVGLAVAAIPEGLPAIVTIMLSIGVTKMAKNNAIIRKLPAVETLGSSSVICSDKTGTLTQNKMKVVEVKDVNGTVVIDKEYRYLLGMASMCTDCEIEITNGKQTALGEATENAIVNEALRIGENKEQWEKRYPRMNEIPFDSDRKLMTTIHYYNGKYRIITKGAPDVLLERCQNYYYNGQESRLTRQEKESIGTMNQTMAEKALRVLAVGYRDLDVLPDQINSEAIEKDLTFVRINWNDGSSKRRSKRSSSNL